jgi:hypothetical protein
MFPWLVGQDVTRPIPYDIGGIGIGISFGIGFGVIISLKPAKQMHKS